MRPLPYPPSPSSKLPLEVKKLRASQSMQTLRLKPAVRNLRDLSVSTAMTNLSLDDCQALRKRDQAISNAMMLPPPKPKSLAHKQSLLADMRNMRANNLETSLVLFDALGDSPAAPVTPSYIPVLSKLEGQAASPITPCRSSRKSPSKSSLRSSFLTKDSNTVGFTAWDVDNRLQKMESRFAEMQNALEGTVTDRHDLEKEQALLRQKGEFIQPFPAHFLGDTLEPSLVCVEEQC